MGKIWDQRGGGVGVPAACTVIDGAKILNTRGELFVRQGAAGGFPSLDPSAPKQPCGPVRMDSKSRRPGISRRCAVTLSGYGSCCPAVLSSATQGVTHVPANAVWFF